MSAMSRLAEDYELTGDEPEILIETILDTEGAVKTWAAYLDETGWRLQ
jgi:hypothetical protein